MAKKNAARLPWAAGLWSQSDEGLHNPAGFSLRSRHGTRALAEAAARRYARSQTARTGGSRTWSGGVRDPEGNVEWFTRDGERD
jgi:hypothetical protein